jgi:hypothetical protein
VVSLDAHVRIARTEAHLCGPEADPYPLAVTITPKPLPSPTSEQGPVAPVLSVRHASDDLCVRLF